MVPHQLSHVFIRVGVAEIEGQIGQGVIVEVVKGRTAQLCEHVRSTIEADLREVFVIITLFSYTDVHVRDAIKEWFSTRPSYTYC